MKNSDNIRCIRKYTKKDGTVTVQAYALEKSDESRYGKILCRSSRFLSTAVARGRNRSLGIGNGENGNRGFTIDCAHEILLVSVFFGE